MAQDPRSSHLRFPEVVLMDPLWLIPIALVIFFAWAGWALGKRGPNRPGEDTKWNAHHWGSPGGP